MYKFSIIVPCYNIENSVKELFEMLHSKSYSNYEVIFVDDCSKDNSFETMKTLVSEYSNFSVYRPEKNGGPGLARNLGLKYAQGEYIVFCDSDDKFDIEVLAKIEDFLSEHTETDMLISPHYSVKKKKTSPVNMYKKYKHGSQVDREDVVLGNLAPWGKFYKTDIIKANQIEFPARRTGEDICFVVSYVTKCNVIYKFDISYYGYVIAQSSITHTKSTDTESTFDVLQPIYREHFPSLEIRMFAQNHLLTKAKYLTDNGASLREIREYFAEQNERYPDWIKNIDLDRQSVYRRQIYKAIYYNKPFMIKLIMFARKIMY